MANLSLQLISQIDVKNSTKKYKNCDQLCIKKIKLCDFNKKSIFSSPTQFSELPHLEFIEKDYVVVGYDKETKTLIEHSNLQGSAKERIKYFVLNGNVYICKFDRYYCQSCGRFCNKIHYSHFMIFTISPQYQIIIDKWSINKNYFNDIELINFHNNLAISYKKKHNMVSCDCCNPYSQHTEFYNADFELIETINNCDLQCLCRQDIIVVREKAKLKDKYYCLKNREIIGEGFYVQWDHDELIETDYKKKLIITKKISNMPSEETPTPTPITTTTTNTNTTTIIDENKRCCICFGQIIRKLALIPCGHSKWCVDCLFQLEKNSEIANTEKKCPICKAQYTGNMAIFD